jgi:hypothetical protein
MTSYRVVHDGKRWEVMKAPRNAATHRQISTHQTKRAAKRKARRKANSGDSLTILKKNGAIQTRVTVQS